MKLSVGQDVIFAVGARKLAEVKSLNFKISSAGFGKLFCKTCSEPVSCEVRLSLSEVESFEAFHNCNHGSLALFNSKMGPNDLETAS